MDDKALQFNKNHRKTKLYSPVGSAAYAWLDKPDTKFGSKFKCTLVLAGDEAAEFTSQIDRLMEELKKELKKAPKNAAYEVSEEDGTISIQTKSGYKPAVLYVNEEDVGQPVYGGSKIRLCVTPYAYTGFGGGVTLRLRSVQVLELGEGGADDFEGFKATQRTPQTTDEDSTPQDDDDF